MHEEEKKKNLILTDLHPRPMLHVTRKQLFPIPVADHDGVDSFPL